MAQIKAKQIKLVAQGDLIVGDGAANGTPLTVGLVDQVLVSNGTTPLWGQVSAAGISLTQGDVFIGDNTNSAAEASATMQGQVVVSGAGPNFDFAVGYLAAQYVTFVPNSTQNIAATNVQTAITEVAGERSYIHTDSVDPTVNNDAVDTAALGEKFKIGDVWVNTLTNNVWQAVDVSTGAAIWTRTVGIASAFVYKGDVDASDSGSLPSSPVAGDWWRVGTTGGTENFNGTWDANGEPNGATFLVGDSIVYGDDGNWHKVDNTDPTITAGDGITVTGAPSYIVSADADEVTITASGGAGTELAVHGGLANQVLIGQGASNDASWGYMDNLYDSNGNIILDGVGSSTPVNYLRVTSSDTGGDITIASAGSDTNIGLQIIAKGLGRIHLDGTQWPDDVAPARSIAVAESAGDLRWETAPDGSGDQMLIYNDTTNQFDWVNRSDIGGNAFSSVAGDTGLATADSTSDSISILGGEAISTTASDDPEVVTIDIDIPELTHETTIDQTDDYFVFYDASAGVHRKANLDDLFTSSGNGQVGQDEAVAAGATNESFIGFFSNTPLNDSNVSVFFNGLKLRSTGWTRTGTTLTLVDSVNGYSTDSGDIISARYEY